MGKLGPRPHLGPLGTRSPVDESGRLDQFCTLQSQTKSRSFFMPFIQPAYDIGSPPKNNEMNQKKKPQRKEKTYTDTYN